MTSSSSSLRAVLASALPNSDEYAVDLAQTSHEIDFANSEGSEGMKVATSILRTCRLLQTSQPSFLLLTSPMHQFLSWCCVPSRYRLAQLDVFRLQNDVYLLPKSSIRKWKNCLVAKLHIAQAEAKTGFSGFPRLDFPGVPECRHSTVAPSKRLIAEWIDCRLLGRLLVRIRCLPNVTPSACTLKVSRRRLLCLLNGQLQHLRFRPHEFVEKR